MVFFASHLVKLLLENGYTVRGSVRDLNDPRKTEHLTSLAGAERLHLFEADVLTGNFDPIFNGCEGVFHTASPFFWNTNDPENELLKPAIDGTRHVLNAVIRSPSVKKVVVTSSNVAVSFGAPKNEAYNENDWSDENFCLERKMFYPLSKIRAEREAWRIHSENADKFDLVTVNPPLILGPMLQPTLNTSSEALLKYLDGSKDKIVNSSMAVVDVRDAAIAHLLSYEKPTQGRLVNVGLQGTWEDVANCLKRLYPEGQIPLEIDNSTFVRKTFDVSKSLNLGVVYTSMEKTLTDSVESLKKWGLYVPKSN